MEKQSEPAQPTVAPSPRRLFVDLLPVFAVVVASRLVVLAVLGSVARARGASITSYLKNWDSKWYLHIAHYGYVTVIPPGHGNSAQCDLGFFPLVPLIVRGTHFVTGLGWTVAGLVSSGIFSLAAGVVLWLLLRDVAPADAATRGVALVYFSPAAVVLSMVYAESYLVFFVSLSLWALRRQRWVLGGLAAACATALDPLGVAACVPCAWAAFEAIRHHRNWRSLIAPALSPLGIVIFFAYLWRHTGNFFEWFAAQRRGWQQGPLGTGVPYDLYKFATNFFRDINPAVKSLGLGLVILAIWYLWQNRPPRLWVSYIAGVLAMAALSPIIGFSPRVLLRAFPLIAFVGATLQRRWYLYVLAGSAVAMSCLAIISSSAHWTP